MNTFAKIARFFRVSVADVEAVDAASPPAWMSEEHANRIKYAIARMG